MNFSNLVSDTFATAVYDVLAVLLVERVKGKSFSLDKEFLMDSGIYIASDSVYQNVLKSWLVSNVYKRFLPDALVKGGSLVLELITISGIKRLLSNYLIRAQSMSFTSILMDVSEIFVIKSTSAMIEGVAKK